MELLPLELRASLPPLGAQADNRDPIVYVRFRLPRRGWVWFVTEGSPNPEGTDFCFFGFVVGMFGAEWGHFSLSELNAAQSPVGYKVERDANFQRGPFSCVVRGPVGAQHF